MQIEGATIVQVALIIGAMLGAAWRFNLYIEKKIETNRLACEARAAQVELKIEVVRSECAHREDIQRIEAAVVGVHKRIDEIFALMMKAARGEP